MGIARGVGLLPEQGRLGLRRAIEREPPAPDVARSGAVVRPGEQDVVRANQHGRVGAQAGIDEGLLVRNPRRLGHGAIALQDAALHLVVGRGRLFPGEEPAPVRQSCDGRVALDVLLRLGGEEARRADREAGGVEQLPHEAAESERPFLPDDETETARVGRDGRVIAQARRGRGRRHAAIGADERAGRCVDQLRVDVASPVAVVKPDEGQASACRSGKRKLVLVLDPAVIVDAERFAGRLQRRRETTDHEIAVAATVVVPEDQDVATGQRRQPWIKAVLFARGIVVDDVLTELGSRRPWPGRDRQGRDDGEKREDRGQNDGPSRFGGAKERAPAHHGQPPVPGAFAIRRGRPGRRARGCCRETRQEGLGRVRSGHVIAV